MIIMPNPTPPPDLEKIDEKLEKIFDFIFGL